MSYALPDGNVQISFSGGRTSAYMLHQILEANGGLPDRARVIFSNTGREMPQTLDFVEEVSHQWGVPITWLEYIAEKPWFIVTDHTYAARAGEPFDALIEYKQILPNVLMRFCTSELKVKTAERYLKSQLGWLEWTNCVGIRADEKRRVNTSPQGNSAGSWVRWYPLVDDGVMQEKVGAFWRASPFDLAMENINGANIQGNCDLCFNKSEQKLAEMMKAHPERAAWWERWEDKMLHRGDYGKWNKIATRRQMRDFVERQGDWIFDAEGALCQEDGGECME